MPLEKSEPFTRHKAISKRNWKGGQEKTLTFITNTKDVDKTEHGLMYVAKVTEGKKPLHIADVKEEDLRELWIKPEGALAICLAEFVPLLGKTLEITKTTGATNKDTRYNAKEVK